jgi:hypothetical protein
MQKEEAEREREHTSQSSCCCCIAMIDDQLSRARHDLQISREFFVVREGKQVKPRV